MSDSNRWLPIRCPKCHHVGCTLTVTGQTVIAVTCVSCGHMWAAPLESLSLDVQEKVRVAAANI